MKKFLSLLLAIFMLCSMLVGCDTEKTNEHESNNASTTDLTNKNTTNLKSEQKKLYELYSIAEAYKVEIKRLKTSGFFSLVDFNQDGILEVVLYGSPNLILHYNGGVRVYEANDHEIYNINKDGTFYWNSDAGKKYGSATIYFSENTCYCARLTKSILNESGSTDNFINSIPVSPEELQNYINKDCEAKAEKFELTEENIDKYINANAMTDKNFFCNDSHHQKFEQYNDIYYFIWRKG